MRTGLITTGLLALALQGCGGGDTTNGGTAAGPPQPAASASGSHAVAGVGPAAPSSAGGPAAAKGTGTADAKGASTASPAPAAMAFVPAAKPGRAPAAILVGARGDAVLADARPLAKAGIASIAVAEPRSLGALRVALANLRARPDIDPSRIAVVAEGAGATLAAKLIAREPAISVAVLGDALSPAAGPLKQLSSTRVLLQRGQDTGEPTAAAAEKLVTAAPAGALMYEHPSLGDATARRERGEWLREMLRS